MGNEFGNLSRILINYDITNDYLLSASTYEDCEEKECVCPWSWKRKKVNYIYCPEISNYYAKLNYILVYYKLLDDVMDDNSLIARIVCSKMQPKAEMLSNEMAYEIEHLQEYLHELHQVEKENKHLPIFTVSEKFGKCLELMVKPKFLSDIDEDTFSKINYWVGIWIYTIDAVLDCVSDHKKKNYNPITAGLDDDPLFLMRARKNEILDILKLCRKNILALIDLYPVYKNQDLIKNLFLLELPKIVCLYLEVDKDELSE